MIRSLQSELDRSNRLSGQNQILIANLRSVIADLQKRLEESEKEIADLRDLNNRHNKRCRDSADIFHSDRNLQECRSQCP